MLIKCLFITTVHQFVLGVRARGGGCFHGNQRPYLRYFLLEKALKPWNIDLKKLVFTVVAVRQSTTIHL